MSNTKLTKADKFAMVKALIPVDNTELLEFIDHEVELLAKKNAKGGEKKPTANQIANEGLKGEILNVLSANDGLMSITDIVKALEGDYTNQKISALVSQMVTNGDVIRVEEKRKAYFKVA